MADEEEVTPEQKMARRWPQPVRVGDLIGLEVSDESEEDFGHVRRVVRTGAGKIQLVVAIGGIFGWGERLVAAPIEVVASLGRHVFSIDMKKDQYATAPTWYGSDSTDIDPNEIIRIAIARR
jgi:hypothetical protein